VYIYYLLKQTKQALIAFEVSQVCNMAKIVVITDLLTFHIPSATL